MTVLLSLIKFIDSNIIIFINRNQTQTLTHLKEEKKTKIDNLKMRYRQIIFFSNL